MGELRIEVERVRPLVFDDGSPVRAASGVARFGSGWLVVQDDTTHAAWLRGRSVRQLRIFPPIDGLDSFSEHDGTKHLKPDLEAACELTLDGRPAVVVLGSGSTAARCRGALVMAAPEAAVELAFDGGEPSVHWADLTSLYRRAAALLGLAPADVNFEGVCGHDGALRWFNRGNGAAGIRSGSVDVDLAGLLAVLRGEADAEHVTVSGPIHYDLGSAGGVALAVTDALALGAGRILLSAAAEDTPNNVDDGPVVGTALSIVLDGRVIHHGLVPTLDGVVAKIEGLSLHHPDPPGPASDAGADSGPDSGSGRDADRAAAAAPAELTVTRPGSSSARVVAVVDADDPAVPSSEILLHLRWD